MSLRDGLCFQTNFCSRPRRYVKNDDFILTNDAFPLKNHVFLLTNDAFLLQKHDFLLNYDDYTTTTGGDSEVDLWRGALQVQVSASQGQFAVTVLLTGG